jgi:hypothetical protein
MGLEKSDSSFAQEAKEATGAFAGGFADVFRRPVQGAHQLATGEQVEQQKAPAGTVNSAFAAAGSMVGNAALFIGSTALTSRLPFAGKVIPYLIGGGVGFLDPTNPDQGIGTRLTHGLTGAATIGLLQHGPKALGSLEASWVPKSDLGRLSLTNGIAGSLNVQADSLLRDGKLAGVDETVASAASWMAMGAAFHGAGKWLENGNSRPGDVKQAESPVLPETTIVSGAQVPKATEAPRPLQLQLPALELGKSSDYSNKIAVPSDSPLAKLYARAEGAVARTETLQYNNGKFGGGIATSFAVRDNNGNLRFLSTNHLTEKALDIQVYDRSGMAHAAEVMKGSETVDLAVLRLKNPAAEKRFSTLQLAPDNVTVMPDGHYAAVGFAAGWDKAFVSEGVPIVQENIRRGPTIPFALRGEAGLCGSPICNVKDSTVAAVYKQAAQLSDDTSGGTSSRNARIVLDMSAAGEQPRPAKPEYRHMSLYQIEDAAGMKADLEGIYGKGFWKERDPDFFHSRLKTIPLAEGQDLTLKAQYFPQQRIVIAEPVALNGAALSSETKWHGTDFPMAGARLGMRLNEDGMPVQLRSFNDPLDVLPRAFERPYTNHLPKVKPVRSIPLGSPRVNEEI